MLMDCQRFGNMTGQPLKLHVSSGQTTLITIYDSSVGLVVGSFPVQPGIEKLRGASIDTWSCLIAGSGAALAL